MAEQATDSTAHADTTAPTAPASEPDAAGGSSRSEVLAAKPISTAEAKRRLLAAAERCDPAALIARNPMTAVATAGVVGLAAGSSRGVPPMILQIIQTAMQLAEQNTAQAANEKPEANAGSAAPASPQTPSNPAN